MLFQLALILFLLLLFYYRPIIPQTAEESVFLNEMNKLENDLIKRNRKDKMLLFERTFNTAIQTYRQTLDNLPDDVIESYSISHVGMYKLSVYLTRGPTCS